MLPTSNTLSCSNIEEQIMKGKNCHFELKKVNVEKVKQLLLSINNDKPSGKDNLDGKLLKMVASDVAGPVCHIFNASIASGVFPMGWKEAKVIPLPKNTNENFSGKNSRPISLLPILSKLLERIVTDQIQFFFTVNTLFSNFQHAYREGHSTGTALTQMTDDCLRHIDNNNIVGAVLLDFSAAFDIIDHSLLLNKLKCYNFTHNAIEWFKSYLSNRKQYVFYNGSFSQVGQLHCGVPQGSCLGPVLFSIFTNDLPLVLDQTTAVMYADDTTLYMPSKSIDYLTVTMNSELESVITWVNSNRLVLNLLKTKSIVFGTKCSVKNKPQLNIIVKGMPIEQVEDTKLLGITLDNKLTWSKQVDKTVAAIGRNLSVIKRCAKYIPQQCIPQIVQTLALTHLDYCPMVWSSAAKKDLLKLQLVQNRAARIALSCPKRTNIKTMHSTLGWPSVEDRLHISLLSFVKGIILSRVPAVLYGHLDFSSDVHTYNTRHSSQGLFTLPISKSNSMQHTVMYRAMYNLHSLPLDIRQTKTKSHFKRKLKKYVMESFAYS